MPKHSLGAAVSIGAILPNSAEVKFPTYADVDAKEIWEFSVNVRVVFKVARTPWVRSGLWIGHVPVSARHAAAADSWILRSTPRRRGEAICRVAPSRGRDLRTHRSILRSRGLTSGSSHPVHIGH